MNGLVVIGVALSALARNKLRSFLTVLGVVIGVAAVIAMVAIGQGARAKVQKTFEDMGTNLLIVMPGSTSAGGFMGGAGSAPTLRWADAQAIRTELSAVRWAAPVLTTSAQVMANDQNWNTSVSGTTADLFQIRSWPLASGRGFEEQDASSGAKVALVGKTVAGKLFGAADPVGQSLRVRGVPFVVIGMLGEKGQSPMGQDNDDAVYIPARTYQAKIEGSLGPYLRGALFVSALSSDDTERAQSQITALLRDRHRLAPSADDDFTVRNLTEFAKAMASSTETITRMLAAIAVVSLLVGGIGIMNIMLVGVVERTREIGTRMAVGAEPSDVLVQFLVEALILAGIGGLVGLGLGWVAAERMSAGLGFAVPFPWTTAALAIAVSCGIGVGFGLYPAVKASRLDPIVALRYEN